MPKAELSLEQAAFAGKVELVRKLLTNGADVHARDAWQRTALHSAAIANNLEIVDLLVAAGAKANVPDKVGDVPLHFAAQHKVCKPVLERLLEVAPEMVNHQNAIGHTPLLVAVDKKWSEGVVLLLKRGADPRMTDISGKSVVDWAPNAKIRKLLEGALSR